MAKTPKAVLELQKATKEYVKKEKTRISNEVAVLKAILNGRTGGAGVQELGIGKITARAENSLAEFLEKVE